MTGEVTIRPATVADVAALKAVYRRASLSNDGDRPLFAAHPELLEWPGSGASDGRTRVAVVDGNVVGFATLSFARGSAELEDLFVDPDRMRSGVGRALVVDSAAVAHRAGWPFIEVDANPHARAFYVRVGFSDLGEVPVEFGTATRMRRPT